MASESSRKRSQSPAHVTGASVTSIAKAAALVLAFCSGAGVMVVELGVARVLTPAFGGSHTVWALTIAMSLLALAAGYWVGGCLADRKDGIRVASNAALLGSAACALVPFLRRPLLHMTLDWSSVTGAALVALVLLGLPLFFFGQVAPALIRGLSDEKGRGIGVAAGGIYAISTLGSLLGTLAGAWMFLYLPILTGFAGTAVIVSIPVIWLRRRPASVAVSSLIVLLTGVLLFAGSGPVEARRDDHVFKLLAARSTPYGEIRVIEQDNRYRFLVANGMTQGGIDTRGGRTVFTYSDALIGLGYLYGGKPDRVLVIGLGAGVIPTALERLGVSVDSVEIDAQVVRLAREFFGFKGDVAVDDGRRYLARSGDRWNAIVVDVFLGATPPWQLFTREAFELFRERLSPGGVVVLNLMGSHTDPGQRPALEAVVTTARSVFKVVDVYPDPMLEPGQSVWNLYVVAGEMPRNEPRQPGDPREARHIAESLARSAPIDVAEGRLLTDEAAPLTPLVRLTSDKVREGIRRYLPIDVLIQ